MPDDPDEIRRQFEDAVNMSPKQLEDWLQTEESQAVGQKKDSDESVGHEMGRHIAEIKRKRKADLTHEDLDRMRKVISYVHRHLAQEPQKEAIETSRWRYSLKNWGHDPVRS